MFILSLYNEVKTKYLYNQVYIYGFNANHPAFKTNRSSGVATISVNPNTRSAGAATISINPARDTPQGQCQWRRRGLPDRYLVEKYNSDDSSLGQMEVSSGHLISGN